MSARALWFVAPGRVEVVPEALAEPSAGQLLVRTLFSGISSGTEQMAYRGDIDPEVPIDETIGSLAGTFRFPFRYGYSCVGVVEASGGGVPAGTIVFAFQPHQDWFVVDAGAVVPLGAVAPRSATLFPLVETALQITLDAGVVLEDTVVVFGLGAVGLLTALMLRRAGAHPIAVEPRMWRRDIAAGLGVEAVAPGQVTAASGGQGVPLVIDASGDPSVLSTALALLRHEGTVLVASWYGNKQVTLPLGHEFHRRRLTIRSTQVSTIPSRLADRWDADRRRRAVVDLLTDLPLDALATHTFAFDRATDAFRAIEDGQEGLIHAALGYE